MNSVYLCIPHSRVICTRKREVAIRNLGAPRALSVWLVISVHHQDPAFHCFGFLRLLTLRGSSSVCYNRRRGRKRASALWCPALWRRCDCFALTGVGGRTAALVLATFAGPLARGLSVHHLKQICVTTPRVGVILKQKASSRIFCRHERFRKSQNQSSRSSKSKISRAAKQARRHHSSHCDYSLCDLSDSVNSGDCPLLLLHAYRSQSAQC